MVTRSAAGSSAPIRPGVKVASRTGPAGLRAASSRPSASASRDRSSTVAAVRPGRTAAAAHSAPPVPPPTSSNVRGARHPASPSAAAAAGPKVACRAARTAALVAGIR